MNYRLMELLSKLSPFKVTNWDTSSDQAVTHEQRIPTQIGQGANVVSSKLLRSDYHHALLLDLDVPAYLVPSTTEGHSHLYVDVEIPEYLYFRLLDVLAEAGVIQTGYALRSKQKGGSALRLPWVKKEALPAAPDTVPSWVDGWMAGPVEV